MAGMEASALEDPEKLKEHALKNLIKKKKELAVPCSMWNWVLGCEELMPTAVKYRSSQGSARKGVSF